MKLGEPAVTKYKTKRKGRVVELHYVRWRIYFNDGRKALNPKKSGFPAKGLAETFVENLRRAELRADGWRFDTKGHPVRDDITSDAMQESVFAVMRIYVAVNWKSLWSASQRSKVRGRLLVLVAALLDDTRAVERVIDAMKCQRPGRGKRPDPVTTEEWAARYLVDHALRPSESDITDGELIPELERARSWLEKHSVPLASVDDVALMTARRHLVDGRPHETGRTYWAAVVAFFNWAMVTRRLDRDPTVGIPSIPRDPDLDRVDADRVPDRSEVWMVAEALRDGVGASSSHRAVQGRHTHFVLILVLAYAALRIGEALGLRRRDVRTDADGNMWLMFGEQHQRQVAADSDDGETTVTRKPTKGRRTKAARKIFIPSIAATEVRELLESLPDDLDAPLFTGVRGEVLDADLFRREFWHPVIAALYPDGHRLTGITPHALRHAGMTWWLRSGMSHKLAMRWGGWRSLKVMLDVYAAVLPDDEDDAVGRLEQAA